MRFAMFVLRRSYPFEGINKLFGVFCLLWFVIKIRYVCPPLQCPLTFVASGRTLFRFPNTLLLFNRHVCQNKMITRYEAFFD